MTNEANQSSLSPESAARRLITALVEHGVDTFFGIPGGPACHLFEAIRLEPRARLIESRHETQAAFAAAIFQRASGRVPAVVVTAGPGITNVVTGAASASRERVPMLIIAGDVAWATTGMRLAQDSGPEANDAEATLRPHTRAQIRAVHERSVVGQALAALDAATDPRRPGPALFVLPMDRAREPCGEVRIVRASRTLHAPVPLVHATEVARALCAAERPLIVFGAGCRGHEEVLRALVDAAKVPFVTTMRAKGLISELHPYSLRHGGLSASVWAKRYTAIPPDVCLALGTDLDDAACGPTQYVGPGTRLYHVDLDASAIGRNAATTLGIVGDLGAFAADLTVWSKRTAPSREQALALDDAKGVSPWDDPEAAVDPSVPIRAHRVICDLVAAMPLDARIISDIGGHTFFALHYVTATAKDSFFLHIDLGSMGSGIGGAIGLAVADPTRAVVCIAGDGCMQMSSMEALVAVKERLPIVFVVLNDGRYNIVHHGMKMIFGDAAQYDMPLVDFSAWAASFGMPAAVVTHPGDITAKVFAVLRANGGPVLLDVRIDKDFHVKGGRVEALRRMSMSAITEE